MTVTLEQVMHSWVNPQPFTVKIELTRERLKNRNTKWRLRLVSNGPTDEQVDWTAETLKNWSTVRRTAWDIWVFDSKRDAEKFITLYNLTWA